MEANFVDALTKFIIKNFNFDPEKNEQKSDSLYNISSNETVLNELNFLNKEISNLFNKESLAILLKANKDFKDNHKVLVQEILISIYNFYKGNKNASDILDIYHKLPLKKHCANIEVCFNRTEDLQCFLIFNFTLMIYNEISEQFLEKDNFLILETLLLYDYTFIHDFIKNIKVKYVIGKIIKVLMNIYIKSSGENDIAFNLKYFFFEKGNINNNSFLVPEKVYENGYKEIDDLIIDINTILGDESSILLRIKKLNDLQDFKRIKLGIEEDNEETEISIESNNNNGEQRDNSNIEFFFLKMNNIINQMKKENEEKMNKFKEEQNLEIEKLKQSIKEQKSDIDSLKNKIINKDITIDINEKNIEELKKDLSLKKKNLKQSESTINEKIIKINNLTNLSLQNSKKINSLTTEVNKLKKQNDILKKEFISLNNKINLIGCRDFLRRIFFDFCYFFNCIHNGKYNDTANIIVDKIKKEAPNSTIKKFAQKVNLIEFIGFLGKLIDDSDDLSHYFFKELSIEYKDQDINKLTTEEIIKANIIKCQAFFNEYSKMDFNSIFSFFINDCNYPNCILNKVKISDQGFFKAVQNYNDNN